MSVTSSESDNGLGDGDTTDDIQEFALDTPDVAGKLRAERAGGGPGRTYTFGYRGEDAACNAATCAATVHVPSEK